MRLIYRTLFHITGNNVNASGVRILAQVSNQYKTTLIHFSTDYVFDGEAETPYLTSQTVDPINVYGESKLYGEKAIISSGCVSFIIRVKFVVSVKSP